MVDRKVLLVTVEALEVFRGSRSGLGGCAQFRGRIRRILRGPWGEFIFAYCLADSASLYAKGTVMI